MDILNNLKLKSVLWYFNEISTIPRESGNDKGISDYLVAFAKERNLEVVQDDALNVIIKKSASKGYENAPTIIIQAHMDMVCEKNKNTKHDFKNDSIKLRIVGDMIYASNTTLGADDGIGLAYGLALLDDDEILHPSLEVLFTAEEETTMNGAAKVNLKDLKGKILINLDGCEEGILLVGSAGGIITEQKLLVNWEAVKEGLIGYRIIVDGLIGGHSGEDIHKQRGNSNKILGRVLNDLCDENKCFINEINGGVKTNAIPRESESVILIHWSEFNIIKNKINKWNDILQNEFSVSDAKVCVKLEKIKYPIDKVFSKETRDKAITSLLLIPNGVKTMSMNIKGLVQSSTNLGVVKTLQDEIVFKSEIRSSVRSLRDLILNESKTLARSLNCELDAYSSYPEWRYNKNSKIRSIFEKVYKEKYKKDMKITVLHAGLECGVFLEKMPDLDVVSYGPNMYEIHTPDEHLSISSVENTWNYIIDVLKEIR